MITSLAAASASARTSQHRLYARFSRRFWALVVDTAVYAVSFVVMALGADLLRGVPAVATIALLLWVLFALLYEPVLVSERGATIGHAYANCRVVDARTGEPPGFWRAFGRLWLKSFVGLFSFVFMATTRRHQALHDLAFGTVVEVRDPSRAREWEGVRERSAEGLTVPAWRRIAVIAGYSVITFVALGVMMSFALSAGCLDFDQCSPRERLWESASGFVWLGVQAAIIVFGWRGRLPGARATHLPTPLGTT